MAASLSEHLWWLLCDMPPGSPSKKDKEVSAAGEGVSRQTSAVSRFRVASMTESPTFKAVPLPELPGFSDGSTWGSEGLTTPDWSRASLEAAGAPGGGLRRTQGSSPAGLLSVPTQQG